MLITALAASVDGVEEHHVGDTACTNVDRRRRGLLTANEVSIDMPITMSTSNYDDGMSASDVVTTLQSAIETAVSSGTLTTSLETAGLSVSATSASVSTVAPTSAPTAVPTTENTVVVKKKTDKGTISTLMIIILVLVVVLVFCTVLVGVAYIAKKESKAAQMENTAPAGAAHAIELNNTGISGTKSNVSV